MPSITPFLWFDDNLEEAMQFYKSVFAQSQITDVSHLEHPELPGPQQVTMASFDILGQKFMGLNGGPGHPLTDAISMFLSVADQAEIDHYWAALTADGGQPGRCGWLTDKFGLTWQVVPEALGSYLGGSDPQGAQRAVSAMLTMGKLDIAALKAAYENG